MAPERGQSRRSPSSSQDPPERKRRAHAKSRKGCGNCKLRRVKCDETRPECEKCLAFGVSCNYDGRTASLDLSTQGSFQVVLSAPPTPSPESGNRAASEQRELSSPDYDAAQPSSSVSPNQTDVAMLYGAPWAEPADAQAHQGPAYWTLSPTDMDTLRRFRERTILTIGPTSSVSQTASIMSDLALTYPFLTHTMLSLTLMHDAHLAPSHSPSLAASPTSASLHHWNIATTLFNRVLSRPIDLSSRDALWATAILFGIAGIAYVESTNPSLAWPLKQTDSNDFNWLRLSDGKKAIWRIADPLRPDSAFSSVAGANLDSAQMLPVWIQENDFRGLDKDEELRLVFGITPNSTIDNNPYHLSLLILARLRLTPPTQDHVITYLLFIGHMGNGFRDLLEVKDPRAVLLMGWFYKLLENSEVWWLRRRAETEGVGVHIWLQTHHSGERGLARLFERLVGVTQVQ
ncbi:hypothetical protein B0J11DRAFT_127104 [Dendryphion nanum]|uniref:Zn(2)-C6 fungal-type domain-containing protein n=1 Tax=Dendryphion nanum TaxID=256645 RepID=A0A9P9D9K4_9PLEO|nr:hypothetical protein B0J11DRAFT_127104 [Dendryphion nanum]